MDDRPKWPNLFAITTNTLPKATTVLFAFSTGVFLFALNAEIRDDTLSVGVATFSGRVALALLSLLAALCFLYATMFCLRSQASDYWALTDNDFKKRLFPSDPDWLTVDGYWNRLTRNYRAATVAFTVGSGLLTLILAVGLSLVIRGLVGFLAAVVVVLVVLVGNVWWLFEE